MKYSSGISIPPSAGRSIKTQCETGCWCVEVCVEGCLPLGVKVRLKLSLLCLFNGVMPQLVICEGATHQTTSLYHLFRLVLLPTTPHNHPYLYA